MNKTKWKERVEWCHFFGEVIDVLDAAGCPPARDVGAAHVRWMRPGTEPYDRFNQENTVAYVTLAGFGNRRVWFTVCEEGVHGLGYADTPAELEAFAKRLAEYLAKTPAI